MIPIDSGHVSTVITCRFPSHKSPTFDDVFSRRRWPILETSLPYESRDLTIRLLSQRASTFFAFSGSVLYPLANRSFVMPVPGLIGAFAKVYTS
jgi:hypothetical protein